MEQLNLKLTLNDNGSITAAWSPITNATRYSLLIYIKGSGYAVCNEQNLTATSCTTRPNLEANIIYDVVLAAYGQGYNALVSEAKRQLIPSDFYRNTPLQVPKNIRANANPTSVEISFDKTDYAEGYDIRFDSNVYSVSGWGTRISKTIYNLKPQTSHTYAVRSKDSVKTSEYSATQTVVTPAIKPSIPHITKKTVTENSATISWAAVSGATSYDIRLNGSVQNVTGTSKTLIGLKPATDYTYQIRARTAGGVGDYGPEQRFRTPPKAPAEPRASSHENSVTINWNVAQGADSYDVICNGKEYHVAKPPLTIDGLSPNTSYSYKVRSNSADGSSSYSTEKKIKTSPMPPEASKVKATASKNSVTISWEKVAGANSYDVRFDNGLYNVSGTAKVFSGLSSGKSYTYAVSARNSDGSSTFTDVKIITTIPEIPPVPQNVKIEVAAESAVVSWDGVSRADSYEVKFGDKVYETTGTSLTITGLLPDKSYSCTVRAKNAGGSSAYTTSKSVRTLKKVPDVPDGVEASATPNSVTVSWNAVYGADSYDVLFNNTAYRVTGGTSRTISGLNPGTGYTYCVRANNTMGSSPYSKTQTIVTIPNAPGVPANISATATENSVTVKWTASAGADSYDVKLGEKIYNVTGTSATVTGLSSNTNYTYCVQAKNAGGVSGYSPSKTVRTLLGVPANVTASAETNSVTISWSAVSGASGYDVLFNNQTYSVTGTSKTITGLAPGTNYTYCVRAKNYSVTSAYSASEQIATKPAPPAVPANVTAVPNLSAKSVTVSWSAVSGANNYELLFNNQTYRVTGTSKTITGLTTNVNYSYQVRAKNAAGMSAYSAVKTVVIIPVAKPVAPGGVTAVATSNSITISWRAEPNAGGYDILFNKRVYSVNGTTKTFTGLSPNTNYTYQIRTRNAAGTSAYSTTYSIKTKMAPPAVPANIKATATSNSVTISWDTNRTVIGYNVQFNGKVYSTSYTSITFSKLTPGTAYDYAVQARNIGGYGAYSAVQTIRTLVGKPSVPKNVSAVSSLSGVTITWDAVSGADNYDVQFDGQASRVAENQYKIYFDLQPGTEHTYCVRANNEGGSSAYSTLGRIKTKTSRQSGLPEGKWHKTYPDGRIPHLGLDPVNVLNGAFLWDYTFLKDYGKDNLHFTLMYDSQRDGCSKILGRGWSHAFNYLLYKDNTYTYFSTPYGEVVPFRKEKDGSGFLPEEGIRSVYAMEQAEDGAYRVKKSDGTTYVFASNLSPDKIMEGELVSYQFHTDADGRIVRIEGRHGGSLVLTYAGGHIASAADLMGNTVRFSYEKDYLISATDCGGNSIAFTYDDDGRLSEITDFSGKKYLTNWYDIYGKVIAQNIAGRGNSTASYDTVNRVTAFTDEAGNQTKYYYNEDSVITCVELGAHAISSSYNENGQVTQQTDLLKNTTQMLYDNLGRMTQVIYPDGTDEQISYNDRSYPVRIVNRDGTESLYEYDSRNNLISAQDERGNQCTYVYDENDNLTSYTDKEGNVWTYAYDENHHLSSAADPEGNAYTYSHDKLGRLNSYTSPAGSTVSYQYSSTGSLLSVTDADGSILFEYDKNGNRTSVTDRNGNSQRLEYNEMGQVSLVTDFMGKEYRFEYDERGNLVKETDPLDFHVSYTYDAMGNRISGTDKNGAVTSYTFNSVNQLTEVRDAAGGTVKYTYDTMGQVKTVTDPLEHQTAYTYDNAGRMTGITDALGYSTAYTYDQAGNLLTRTDEDGAVTKYSYDKENRLLSIKTDAGITSFTYDKLGRVVSVTDAEEQKEQRVYDGDGNLTSATDKDGNQTTYTYHTSGRLAEKTDPDGGKTAYAYDSNGNCIKVTDAEGNIYSYEYDGDNRLVKVTNPLEQETAYAYDDRGQLISITDAKGGETTFAYDGNGNLTRKTNPLGGAKSYIYDVLNRLAQSTDEEGNTCTYTYDAAGNRTSYTDANGNKWTYTYDARNRLISVAGQDDGSLTYAYTGTGRIAKVTDQEGTETDYQYDSMGRLIRMSDGLENSLTFTYDSLGRMLTQTDANGNTTEFTYSPAGNLIKVKDAEEGETLYTYNGAGQVLTVTDPLGNTVSYEYDVLGHVTMVTDPMNGKITLTYTADGQIATVTDQEGSVTEYAYDACGNLIQTVNPLGVTTLYEYDAMNNRIKECLSDSGEQTCITLYQYDKRGRRIKEINPALEEKVYTYDGSGNLSSMTDEDNNKTTVSYDLNNKPVHMAYSDGKEASFRYNKRGELVEISDWNGITSMEHDEVGRLTKVTDPDSRTVCYSYDGAGNITGITYPDGSVVNYAYDKNNRMTEAADKDGKAVWYTYDGAGRVGSRCQPDSTVSYAYNAKGLPVQITHRLADADFLKETLSYDKAGRITGLERVGENLAIAGSMSYAYDGAGQLVSYRRGQNTETYGYDLLGNRTFRKTNGADGAVYQYNALNQLVSLSEDGKQYTCEYDKRGNLIQESLDGAAVRRYTYNAANRMTLGKNLETGEETRYDYNALYMRIKNVQTLAGQEPSEEFLTKETSYVPDYLSITNNDLMACEKDADAASTIFGQGHERLVRKTASGKVYFQPDLYGSILSVSDGQGQNLGYSEWDVWGNVKFHGQGSQPRPEGGAVPGFTSYIPDPVTGKYFAQARFYDPAHGRMLAPDPVKRGLNGYPYCGNDPVNYVDPTGEVANILAGGILGGIMGGTFGFAGSAISQIAGGKEFDVREALGAGANGMVVGAVRGALIGSGAGLPVALVSDFTAGTVGSTLEQLITGGKADAGKSIAGGLTNAVSGAIYGNNPLGSLKEAFGRGAAAGAATSGINYLSEIFGGQDEERRSGTLRGSLGLVPFGRVNDPRHGCMARDPFGGMTEGGSDYGYQYQIPRRERTVRKAPERFSLAEFAKEVVTGFVMGGLASAAFYGAGRAVEAVKSSVRSGCEGGNIVGKLDTNKIPNMTKRDIVEGIPNDWNYTDHNGFVHIRDAEGNMRIRIDPSDKVTNYPHVHVYDINGNLLDSFGNIVDRKSPKGHIPYKDN